LCFQRKITNSRKDSESSAIAPCNPRVLLSFEEQFIVPKVKKKSIMIVITQRKTLLDFIINKGK
jgi:hypothetical protein